ncbi:hypothetical protein [Oceanispirochaeta crateris]|uniref:hypothetical protein n=1 Tax=Oceanispirochaeta crateris TaxID=2518645 RepID=UPI00143D70ED|nr:hypothetical protein [Oceanispirochaeta crateris]
MIPSSSFISIGLNAAIFKRIAAFFTPLPDDYRLDFAIYGNTFFDFDNLALQLIVPLN